LYSLACISFLLSFVSRLLNLCMNCVFRLASPIFKQSPARITVGSTRN
jgi:hypothetical protein